MEQRYRQCELRHADDTRQMAWLPEELARPGRWVRIGEQTWYILSVWRTHVTMELLSNQRDAQRDRALTIG